MFAQTAMKVFEDSKETFFKKIEILKNNPKKSMFAQTAMKVFEDSKETFFKKFLWWGTGQSPRSPERI